MYNEDFQYNFISIIIIWKYNKKKLTWIKNINGDSSCIKYFILTITDFQYFLLNILFYFVLLNFCCNYDKGYLFVYYKKKNIVKHWYRENRVVKFFNEIRAIFFFTRFVPRVVWHYSDEKSRYSDLNMAGLFLSPLLLLIYPAEHIIVSYMFELIARLTTK